MLIYGFRPVRWTTTEGSFHCPTCQGPASYRDRDVRMFFTLYFIPVIPLWREGRVIACKGCQTEWDPAVLTYDPEEESRRLVAGYHDFLTRTMVLMAVMDGDLDDHEIEMIRTILAEAGMERERIPTPGALQDEAVLARESGTTVEGFARALGGDLTPQGKGQMLAAAYEVMMASPDPRKQAQLTAAAKALGISSDELLGIMNHVEEKRDQQAGTLETLRGV